MSLEKQLEQMNKSIADLIGAVDANTKVIVALMDVLSPGGTAEAIQKAPIEEECVIEGESVEAKQLEPEEEPVVEASTIDIDALKKAFVALVNTHGSAAMADILTQYNAKKISDLEAVEYPQVMADIKDKMGDA